MTYIDLLSRNLAKSAITAALLELSEESINFTDVTINSSEEDGEISEISFSSSDSDDEETVKVTLEQREALLLSLEQSELAPVVLKTKNELSVNLN